VKSQEDTKTTAEERAESGKGGRRERPEHRCEHQEQLAIHSLGLKQKQCFSQQISTLNDLWKRLREL
jgi:hypothetical protein